VKSRENLTNSSVWRPGWSRAYSTERNSLAPVLPPGTVFEADHARDRVVGRDRAEGPEGFRQERRAGLAQRADVRGHRKAGVVADEAVEAI
jgi:hypothetical protein